MVASKHKAWCYANHIVYFGSDDSGFNVFAIRKRYFKSNNNFSQFDALHSQIWVHGAAGSRPVKLNRIELLLYQVKKERKNKKEI